MTKMNYSLLLLLKFVCLQYYTIHMYNSIINHEAECSVDV